MGPRPVDSSKPNVTNGATHSPDEADEIGDQTDTHGPGAHATCETASELLLRIRTEREKKVHRRLPWVNPTSTQTPTEGAAPPPSLTFRPQHGVTVETRATADGLKSLYFNRKNRPTRLPRTPLVEPE